jgi:hypothetical protein
VSALWWELPLAFFVGVAVGLLLSSRFRIQKQPTWNGVDKNHD